MDYKKILKNKELRINILHCLRFVPDALMIKIQYRIKMDRKLNLRNPKRYSEKIQWYKLNYRTPLMTQCADKYSVRDYIRSKGLNSILTEMYAVYDRVHEINIESLPEKFVMKTTNGSGTNIFCKDKTKLSLEDTNKLLTEWIKRDNFSSGREWSYKHIVPRIIVEEYLEDRTNQFDGINDYKFLCFNGKAEYIVLDVDRQVDHKRNIYDKNWMYIDVSTDHDNFGDCVPKPDGLDEMLRVANILAVDFPCVRVDLYWVNDKVYFGEMTFYPWTGYVNFSPDEFDFTLGSHFQLIRH
ncbi:ATP-grasp fold amidoligase family protein [Paenibacillus sp. FSL R10-2734]|uniref:ATP-grasp fold amidoligase family protein n=1 Tax=Paenibacillus sp. FSL R10-2734 TaxID=2954691 RepID=UPI0030D728F6